MEKVLIIFVFAITGHIQGQRNFEQGMDTAFQFWKDGEIEKASDAFKNVTGEESWLPNYYIALLNTISAFEAKDFTKLSAQLNLAQTSLDIASDKSPKNAELLVVQAMIHTAWIAFDPMSYGQKLSPVVMRLYNQAETMAPNNPRVILSKARFEMGSAQFFGTEIGPICSQIERSIDLFDNFKVDSKYAPKWGKDQAIAILNNCK